MLSGILRLHRLRWIHRLSQLHGLARILGLAWLPWVLRLLRIRWLIGIALGRNAGWLLRSR